MTVRRFVRWEPAPPDPGLKPNGIRIRALSSPAILRRNPKIISAVKAQMQRREQERLWGRE